jgi:hypothetical protein
MPKSSPKMPLPKGRPVSVKSGVLHVIALAQFAMTYARGWAADSVNIRVRLKAKLEQVNQDNVLLREELRIKDARMSSCLRRSASLWQGKLAPPVMFVAFSRTGPASSTNRPLSARMNPCLPAGATSKCDMLQALSGPSYEMTKGNIGLTFPGHPFRLIAGPLGCTAATSCRGLRLHPGEGQWG